MPHSPWIEIRERAQNYSEYAKVIQTGNVAGCGGLNRSEDGTWICGFSKELHVDSFAVASNLVAKQGGAATGWSIVQNNLEVLERGRF
ncbi:hypothetical protein L195_g040715 [Trifolium pratense]|nr:hypothetical protein L195_g034359 [Trifolium pratense]PNX84652.1 hypothetical protein L195_g040715 [Trifolium pratense]